MGRRERIEAIARRSMKFMGERNIVPETMTPDQARDLLKEIRETDDPRIRDFNRSMRMLRGPVVAVTPADEAGPGNVLAHAHQQVARMSQQRGAGSA